MQVCLHKRFKTYETWKNKIWFDWEKFADEFLFLIDKMFYDRSTQNS